MAKVRLRFQIKIQRSTETRGAAGQPEETWADHVECFCDRKTSDSVSEDLEAQRITPIGKYNLTVREHIDVKETDRIIDWDDRIHKIIFIEESDLNRGVMYKTITTELQK